MLISIKWRICELKSNIKWPTFRDWDSFLDHYLTVWFSNWKPSTGQNGILKKENLLFNLLIGFVECDWMFFLFVMVICIIWLAWYASQWGVKEVIGRERERPCRGCELPIPERGRVVGSHAHHQRASLPTGFRIAVHASGSFLTLNCNRSEGNPGVWW